jgi:hypothetical protein
VFWDHAVLIRFIRSTRQWTWIAGTSIPNADPSYGTRLVFSAAATPGARAYSCGAVDSSTGALLLYGGYDSLGNSRGDIWSWNGSWLWLAGLNSTNQLPSYPIKGAPTPANVNGMGGRSRPTCWHFNGTFYIGFGANTGNVHLDLSEEAAP